MRLLRRGRDGASSLDLLVAGLGNPGREYSRNRHNVGFLVADELVRRHGGSFRGKFSGELAELRIGDATIGLLKPQTYMNESGRSVVPAARSRRVAKSGIMPTYQNTSEMIRYVLMAKTSHRSGERKLTQSGPREFG